MENRDKENVVPLSPDKVTRFPVEAAVLAAMLEILNQLPRGQANPLATAIEQIIQRGPIEDEAG